MSNLLAQTTQPSQVIPAAFMLIVLLWTLAAGPAAWASGLFDRRGPNGSVRFGAREGVGWFLLALAACFGGMIVGASLLLVTLLRAGVQASQAELTANVLGSVIIVLVFIGLYKTRAGALERIGMTSVFVLPGAIKGALILFIVFPLVFWMMLLSVWFFSQFGVDTSRRHEVFELWDSPGTSPGVKSMLVVAAVIVAPLAEEVLFRGLLQTGLLRLFTAWRAQPESPQPPPLPSALPGAALDPLMDSGAMPAPVEPEPPGPPAMPHAGPDVPAGLSRPSIRARWAAILIAAAIFAAIHTLSFHWPALFILAVGMGYVYERTGNLWAPIFTHMFFNGFQFSLAIVLPDSMR